MPNLVVVAVVWEMWRRMVGNDRQSTMYRNMGSGQPRQIGNERDVVHDLATSFESTNSKCFAQMLSVKCSDVVYSKSGRWLPCAHA